MGKFKDLTGQKFGRLTVIDRAENSKNGRARWRCKCDCGGESVVCGYQLISGKTKSCGCLQKEFTVSRNFKHGMGHSRAYKTWQGIKKRCLNPARKDYIHYGGRGIRMYEPWINNPAAFIEYVTQLSYFGEEGYSLDRINNDGDYEPGNLRWADIGTQNRNTRQNHIVEYQGRQMTLIEASRLSGIDRRILSARSKRGDKGDRLFRPVRKINRK